MSDINATMTAEVAQLAASLAVGVSRYNVECRNQLVASVLAMLVDVADINLDEVTKMAKSIREDRRAEFGCGLCSSLDDPAEA